jgi:hypothetical protein
MVERNHLMRNICYSLGGFSLLLCLINIVVYFNPPPETLRFDYSKKYSKEFPITTDHSLNVRIEGPPSVNGKWGSDGIFLLLNNKQYDIDMKIQIIQPKWIGDPFEISKLRVSEAILEGKFSIPQMPDNIHSISGIIQGTFEYYKRSGDKFYLSTGSLSIPVTFNLISSDEFKKKIYGHREKYLEWIFGTFIFAFICFWGGTKLNSHDKN